jgi:hypothetical protein
LSFQFGQFGQFASHDTGQLFTKGGQHFSFRTEKLFDLFVVPCSFLKQSNRRLMRVFTLWQFVALRQMTGESLLHVGQTLHGQTCLEFHERNVEVGQNGYFDGNIFGVAFRGMSH